MNKEILIAGGIDYNEAEQRFNGKTEIYEKFLKEITEIRVISALEEKIQANDIQSAFETARDLKSNFGNLSIKPLYEIFISISAALKENDTTSINENLAELQSTYDKIVEVINQAQ